MNRLSIVQGLKRVTATNPAAAERMERGEQETYVQEVERAIGWLTDDQWAKVVDWAVTNRKHRSLPSIAEWREIVSSVRKSGGIPSLGECPACRSTGWVCGIYRVVATGEYLEAAQVCGKCQKRHSTPQNAALEFVCVPSDAMLMAVRCSPRAARAALEKLEDQPRAKIDEAAHLILLQRANEEQNPKDPPVKNLSDVIGDLMAAPSAGSSSAREVEI